MERYIITKAENGTLAFFAGYPTKFTFEEKDARIFWSTRGARTALGHLQKRYLRAGRVVPSFEIKAVQR